MKKFFFILLLLLQSVMLWAATSVSGIVVDAQTGETLPFVQIYFMKPSSEGSLNSGIGTTSDMDGNFSIGNDDGYTTLAFQMMGYKTEMVNLKKDQVRKQMTIKMQPDVYGLQDIVVTPKRRKQQYKRKGNPAVELIQQVIAHKDSGNVQDADRYTASTYSRMSFALDNFYPNFEKGFWKNFAFAEKYIDTTGVYPSVTVSIRENTAEEYYQKKPHREKKITQLKRVFGIEDIVGSAMFQENVNAIFKDVNIYQDNMPLLFNRFVSPLSSTLAVAYYQYYIQDTIMVDGYKCIDLSFVPVNSESYSFTGHLYITCDSTYKLKKYAINVPPHINLNFVANYSVEHSYTQLDNGLWAPERTNIYSKFYILSKKKGMLARQTKLYTDWDFESPIDKEVFSSMTSSEPDENDSTAVRLPSLAWDTIRPEPLTHYESSVYNLVQEFTSNPTFASLAQFVNAVTTEFVETVPASKLGDSKFDFGPIWNFVSWNPLEGPRFRLGGMSTANMHPQMFFRGYVAYGINDNRVKGNLTLNYSFNKKKYHPYQWKRDYLELTLQHDVEEPGQLIGVIDRDNILMSIPLSKPTMKNYQYVAHAKLEYVKELENHLSFRVNFDAMRNQAAGSMRYIRVLPIDQKQCNVATALVDHYYDYQGGFEIRYAPGSHIPIDRVGRESTFSLENDAPVIKFNHFMGYLDDRMQGGIGFFYNHTEITAEKRFWLSSFGHLDARLQSGIIWNKVPFTKLYIPQTSTSIFLGQNAFNLMQPMEFLMDQYVALYATYYFKGWILNRIPGINRLKLRGVVSFSGIYGALSAKNNPYLQNTNTGLYYFPDNAVYDDAHNYVSGYVSSPIGKLPYMELTAGFENIFKFIRIDYVRRLTYNDYMLPDGIHQRKVGAWGRNGVKVSIRFAL